MAVPRSWRTRVVIGVLLAGVAVLAWVRREAHIATTPTPPVSSASGTSAFVGQESDRPRAVVAPLDVATPAPQGVPAVPPTAVPPTPPPPPAPVRASGVRLDVGFVSQAPFRVWDLPYKEYCEEASALTLHYWIQGKQPPAADQIDRDLSAMQAWEEANIGHWESTDANAVVRMLREHLGHAGARVVRDVTIADIDRALDARHPVIVPARGRELANPYFTPPGPLYHMLVVIGYDADEFITNDVGTNTKGAGFRYAKENLYDAIADWSDVNQAPTGGKAMIIVE